MSDTEGAHLTRKYLPKLPFRLSRLSRLTDHKMGRPEPPLPSRARHRGDDRLRAETHAPRGRDRRGEPDGALEPAPVAVHKVSLAVPAEEQYPAHRGHRAVLVTVTKRIVSKSRRASLRTGANDSEAARKSRPSELRPGIGCSSNASLRAKRRGSSTRSGSARRLVEPTRIFTRFCF